MPSSDPPQELLDASGRWKEGLLPKAVTKEPKTLKRNTVCGFELSRQALSLNRLRIAEASVRTVERKSKQHSNDDGAVPICQRRPVRSKTTTMIRTMPRIPTPP